MAELKINKFCPNEVARNWHESSKLARAGTGFSTCGEPGPKPVARLTNAVRLKWLPVPNRNQQGTGIPTDRRLLMKRVIISHVLGWSSTIVSRSHFCLS